MRREELVKETTEDERSLQVEENLGEIFFNSQTPVSTSVKWE